LTNPDTMPKDLQVHIAFLQPNNFTAECQNCSGKMNLSEIAFFDAEYFKAKAKELFKDRSQLNT
jgi:hypothetical protein